MEYETNQGVGKLSEDNSETEKLDVWAHNIKTTAIRGTLLLALDTFVNIYSRLKEDEKKHNIPYFEIDLFHLKFISIVLINYFCRLFQNSTELFAFSRKLILLFVSFHMIGYDKCSFQVIRCRRELIQCRRGLIQWKESDKSDILIGQ